MRGWLAAAPRRAAAPRAAAPDGAPAAPRAAPPPRAAPAPAPRPPPAAADGLPVGLAALGGAAESGSDDDGAGGGGGRRGGMTEAKRLAIQEAMRRRGALPQEHRRAISNAMRAAHAANPRLRAAGRPKRCGLCGGEGHNRKTCPQAPAAAPAAEAAKTPRARRAATPPPPCAAAAPAAAEAAAAAAPPPAPAAPPPQRLLAPPPPPPRILAPPSPPALDDDGAPPPGSAALVFPLPARPDQAVAQAVAAVLRGWDDGVRRHVVELPLPEPVPGGGWPGGIRQQFRVALPLVEALLRALKRRPGLEGRVTAEWLDEGDCVAAWQSERLAAVLFPSAEALPALRRLDGALSGRRLVVVVNPQWRPAGQLAPEFGFGAAARADERYVASLEPAYVLRRARVAGAELRVLRAYPGPWQVHLLRGARGGGALLAADGARPGYDRLAALAREARAREEAPPRSWLDRVLSPAPQYGAGAWAWGDGGGGEGGGGERDIVTGEPLDGRGGA
jgi:hypothetical protein